MLHQFKMILCPTDFTEESYHAIDYGLSFAKLSDGILLLAHILHNPTSELFHPEGYYLSFDQAKVRAQSMLTDIRNQRLGGYAKCELFVDIGDPYEQLMSLATQRKVDLVVTATKGRSAVEQLLIGSVAEKLIRHAVCPVFVVRRGAY